ncbi:hypothetical protein PVBG_02440 [Plasmodium vivax Brazil I]|uniref:Uncharacterized protein n=1 Tax=Plasmodium vivax (strain Brazil I) TaxID=1033975 RepID=A0A0J9VD84_PLAV1|nr:hypothetical protein PVBG_02440 [Plasmodium vivax Brazil I]
MVSPDLEYYEDQNDKNQISELLKELSLYKFYEKIDKEFNKKYVITNCEVCNEKIKVIGNPELQLRKLCIEVCNFILDDENNKYFSNDQSYNSSCNRMRFRLYDHVMKNNVSPDNIKNFYQALESISKRDKSKSSDCPIVNFNVNKDEFINFKYLYEFLFNYMDIRHKISEERNPNTQLYCKYIKIFFQFYNKIKDSCPPRSTIKYCTALEELRNKFITHGEITNVYNKCKYEKTPCKEGTDVSNDIPCLKDKGNGFTTQKSGEDPRSLLRSRMNKRKNMLEHVYENNYDHLGNISKDEVPNSDSRDYNVLYQSDKNI